MKNPGLFFLLLLLFPCAIYSQVFGLKIGGNHSYMDESRFPLLEAEKFISKGGWHFGLYGDIPLSEKFGFQLEVLYNRKGVGIEMMGGKKQNANYEYFDWPILVYYQWRGIQFQLGASAGMILNHYFFDRELGTRMNFEFGEWKRRFDMGMLGGLEYQRGRFQLGLRYEVAATHTAKFISIFTGPGVRVGFDHGGYHRNLLISLGYAIIDKS